MLDETAGVSAPAPRCMWCSAELPSANETTCPSCGATLIGDGDAQVPGLTAIDADAILRNARAVQAKPRSRLMSWISGEFDESEGTPAPPGSLSPPSVAERREMLRLELEAQVANAQAEAEAMHADAVVEESDSTDRTAGPATEGFEDADSVESAGEAPAAIAAPAATDALAAVEPDAGKAEGSS